MEKTLPSIYCLRVVLGSISFKNPLLYSCRMESLHGNTAATGMAKDTAWLFKEPSSILIIVPHVSPYFKLG